VALPLFALNQWLVWRHGGKSGERWKRHVVLHIAALVALVIFKMITTERLGTASFLDRSTWILEHTFKLNVSAHDYGFNIRRALSVHYGEYFILIPRVIWKIICAYPDRAHFDSAFILFLGICVYMFRALGQSEIGLFRIIPWPRFLAFSFFCFFLGYGIFLLSTDVAFSTTGINNRTAIAASMGVALSFTATTGWLDL